MTQATASEVILHRLILQGETTEIDAARAPVQTALEQISWPATMPGEFLFLRRVTGHGNPREIAARAANHAHRLADSAVDGWSAAAPNALAVRFSSHASLIACLLRDLLQGVVQKRWYWRRWQRVAKLPASEAIVTLLSDEPLALPAVIMQLRTTAAWKSFWERLESTGAATLLAATAQETGWNGAIQMVHTMMNATKEDEAAAITTHIAPLFDLTFLNCERGDARPLLAALLTLWQRAPTLLNLENGATQLWHLARTIAGESTTAKQFRSLNEVLRNPEEILPIATALHPNYDNALRPSNDTDISSLQIPPRPPFSKEGMSEAATDSENNHSASPTCRQSPALIKSNQRTNINGQGKFKDVPPLKESEIASFQLSSTSTTDTGATNDGCTIRTETLIGDFITPQGGLFYLLNFLNLPSVQKQLPADLPGAGWRWLHDLAAALNCPPEGGILEFIAQQCGIKNGIELMQLPLIAPAEDLLRLGASRYGDEVWNADTWRIPARLIATASHIDLHFRLSDASLAIRRVGLDINPGWLPWLGRVVTFHYGSGMEPGR